MEERNLYWLAGLLEGEGCFSLKKGKVREDGSQRHYAYLQVNMTDKDVIERLAEFLGSKVGGPYRPGPGAIGLKDYYSTNLSGQKLVLILEKILPIMGQRRKAKIEGIIASQIE